MRKLFMIMVAVFGMTIAANAANYAADDAAIDALVEAAFEAPEASASFANTASAVSVNAKSDVAAILLDFFLGGFGIHRHYMGTAKWMWAAYTFTFGGIFGIVPLVDFIVMIIDAIDGGGLGQYYGCTKFFMWL